MSKKKIDVLKYIKPSLSEARKRNQEEIERLKFTIEEDRLKLGYGKKYFVRTYGCQGNVADTETIEGILELMGYERALEDKDADIIILNTCAIRENAENKVWGQIGRLKAFKRTNPDLLLGVAGCMSQEENVVERILKTYRHVDLVFGTHNIHNLPRYIEQAIFSKERVIEVYSQEGDIIENLPRVRDHNYKAWVNIMFGCNEFCTYCIVPYTRGKERSRLKEDIINEVKELVADGYKEVTLLGQNVNAYGKDFDTDYTFGDLLRDLDETGIKRIRFTTSHPHDLDLKTMEAMRDCKHVMPHFHLPVQSGSNSVIKLMNRYYTKESYLEVLNKLKEMVPGISITTDIIVGFPNETEEDFLDTLDLVEKAQFEGAYTFIFSPREGTPAAKFKDMSTMEEKRDRLQRLNKKINEGYLRGNERFLNQTVKVLVDGPSKQNEEILSGYTEHNKLVNFKGPKELVGQIVEVKVTLVKTWFMMGELV